MEAAAHLGKRAESVAAAAGDAFERGKEVTTELYVFTGTGLHRQTLNALTGATL
jgi:hypothetical protein